MHVYLVLIFQKCVITFCTIPPCITRNSRPCVAGKLPGSAQVPLAGTQFLTLASSLLRARVHPSSRGFAVGFAFPSHR